MQDDPAAGADLGHTAPASDHRTQTIGASVAHRNHDSLVVAGTNGGATMLAFDPKCWLWDARRELHPPFPNRFSPEEGARDA